MTLAMTQTDDIPALDGQIIGDRCAKLPPRRWLLPVPIQKQTALEKPLMPLWSAEQAPIFWRQIDQDLNSPRQGADPTQ